MVYLGVFSKVYILHQLLYLKREGTKCLSCFPSIALKPKIAELKLFIPWDLIQTKNSQKNHIPPLPVRHLQCWDHPWKNFVESVLLLQVLFAEVTHLLISDAGLSKIRLLIHPLNVTLPEMK